jgi:putative ABC transport system ATP-binding protein
MTTLGVEDLTIEYTQAGYVVRPIEELTFSAGDGELVILLGPSGSGKTTLLSCLASLLHPKSGKIRVGRTEVTGLAGGELEDYRRATVGIVFQAFNLIPSLTARENVAIPLRLAGGTHTEANRRADELLERVGLVDRADHLPSQLSGGQQQRVAIARALVHDPPLVVADEPTAHLDYVQVEEVIGLIRELASPGRLVVVATHDDRFTPLADRVVDLAPKHEEAAGAPREIELGENELLFEQGDPAQLIYVVEEGEIELFRPLADGGEEHLSVRGRGTWFGEMGPMLGLPRSASARAAVPSRLTGYGLQAFRRWQAANASPEGTPTRRFRPGEAPARR